MSFFGPNQVARGEMGGIITACFPPMGPQSPQRSTDLWLSVPTTKPSPHDGSRGRMNVGDKWLLSFLDEMVAVISAL